MTNSEIVIKWAFERVFNGSVKLTKAIHSSLKATILVLAGVEVSLSGPMHSKTKQVLLRDKIFEQSKAFINTQMIANGIPVLPYVTTNLLKSADIFEKTEWKISTTTDTTWRSYQLEVKDLRNNILPLWDALVKLVGKGADGSLKVPSGKALVELLDKFLLSVYLSEQKFKDRCKVINIDNTLEENGGSTYKASEANRNDIEEPSLEENGGSTDNNDSNNDEECIPPEVTEDLPTLKHAPTSYFFKLIILFALVGPLAKEPADFTKIASSTASELTAVKKNVIKTEMSVQSLKAAAQTSQEVCANVSTEKKQKFEVIAKEKNLLLRESVANQKMQTESLKRIQESVVNDAEIRRAQSFKRTIDEDIECMKKEGDDLRYPEEYKRLKEDRTLAVVSLRKLLAPPTAEIDAVKDAFITPLNDK